MINQDRYIKIVTAGSDSSASSSSSGGSGGGGGGDCNCKPEIIDVDSAVNLNTLTKPGKYRLHGNKSPFAAAYPFSALEGSELYMTVSKLSGYSNSQLVTQTIEAADLSSSPLPYVRTFDGASFSSWEQGASKTYLDKNAVGIINVSQSAFNVAAIIRTSVQSYLAPDGTQNRPIAKTAPSSSCGVKLAIKYQYSNSVQGTFGGVVMAIDENCNFFLQADRNIPEDANGNISDSAINWNQVITSPVKNKPSIADATDSTQTETINAVLALLRSRGMLK